MNNEISIFAGWNKSSKTRSSCASGGIFYTIAKQIVTDGGVAVGAAFDENLMVHHVTAENVDQLEYLKSSKYVQSGIGGVFPKVKELLESGRQVVFSGTPCQVTALNRYCGEYSNLLTCSFFCYGTPMPKVYEAYKQCLESEQHSRICAINFKDKRYGWDCYATNIMFENGKSICRYGSDSYKSLMQAGYSLANGCLDCRYDYVSTNADIILGDFYAFSDCCIGWNAPKNGVSVIVVKSGIGERILKKMNELILIPVATDTFEVYEKPKQRNFDRQKRDRFLNALDIEGYQAACELVDIHDQRLTPKQKLIALRKRLGK